MRKTDEFAPSSVLTVPLVIAASIGKRTHRHRTPPPPWDEVSYLLIVDVHNDKHNTAVQSCDNESAKRHDDKTE